MSYVIRHAMTHAWAEFVQDKDYYIQPARITPNGGSLQYVTSGLKTINLPNHKVNKAGIRYHVYHIGQIPTHVLGIENVDNKWISIDRLTYDQECFINVFLENGHVVPRSKCYLIRTWPEKNILLAIEHTRNVDYGEGYRVDARTNASYRFKQSLDDLEVHIRFYTNQQIFQFGRRIAKNVDNQVYFETGKFTPELRHRYNLLYRKHTFDYIQRPTLFMVDGHVYDYKSFEVEHRVTDNKELSAYWDSNIIHVETQPLQSLPVFTSKKDKGIRKYLLLFDVETLHRNNLREDKPVFHNDVEYILMRGNKGVFIPRLRKNTVTTLATCIHAIRTDVITDLMTANGWDTSDDIKIMMVVRQGGVDVKPIYRHARIHELLRLPRNLILDALMGVNSSIDVWKAENLELDPYATLIAGDMKDITLERVSQGYGYNALTKYHHFNPVKPYNSDDNQRLYQLSNVASERPKGIIDANSPIEMICYDENGHLIDIINKKYLGDGNYTLLPIRDKQVELVEHYVNYVGNDYLNDHYTAVVKHPSIGVFGHRCFITTSPVNSRIPKYIDVTDNERFYSVVEVEERGVKSHEIRWNEVALLEIGARPITRIEDTVVYKDEFAKHCLKQKLASCPVIEFPMKNYSGRNFVTLPPGHIDIWMEDRHLIDTIDYMVRWPYIYILKRVQDLNTARIKVRISGSPNPETMKPYPPREVGFIKDGVVSLNGRYGLFEDKNLQLNIGGSILSIDDYQNEDELDPTKKLYNFNGRPYQIRDYITPIELYTDDKTGKEKSRALALDKQVEDFINHHIPLPEPPVSHIVNTRWMVTSVLMDYVIALIRSGWKESELKKPYDVTDVSNWMEDFIDLLLVELALIEITNFSYLRLLPHGHSEVIELTPEQYKFIEYLNNNFLKGKVQTNHLLSVKVN